MKLEFTTQEHRDLLDLLSIALWVVRSRGDHEDQSRIAEYEKVVQKCSALAGATDSGNLFAFDGEAGPYLPTEEFTAAGTGWQFGGESEENSFWEELVDRLAERDAIRAAGGPEAFEALPEEQRLARLEAFWERYSQEFVKNGLANVVVQPLEES